MVHDPLTVVGMPVEEAGRKTVRVEVRQRRGPLPRRAGTQGQPTLK